MFVHWNRLPDFLHRSWMACIEEAAKAEPPSDPSHIVIQVGNLGIVNISWITEEGQVQLGFVRSYRRPLYR